MPSLGNCHPPWNRSGFGFATEVPMETVVTDHVNYFIFKNCEANFRSFLLWLCEFRPLRSTLSWKNRWKNWRTKEKRSEKNISNTEPNWIREKYVTWNTEDALSFFFSFISLGFHLQLYCHISPLISKNIAPMSEVLSLHNCQGLFTIAILSRDLRHSQIALVNTPQFYVDRWQPSRNKFEHSIFTQTLPENRDGNWYLNRTTKFLV